MAISLGGFKQRAAKRETAERLAKEYEKQQKRESKRSGWSKFLGGTGGKLLSGAMMAIPGLGLAAPLVGAIGSFAAKKLAHDVTKGMGAKTGKLEGDKFGFGKEEAKTLREGLESQLRESDPMKQHGAFGAEVLGSYTSAGIEGSLGKHVSKWLGGEDAVSIEGGIPSMISEGGGGYDDLLEGVSEMDEWGNPISSMQQGGQVPSQEELLLLLALAEEQGQKAYDGTVLEEPQQPTIADYFSSQNKTLGGNNTKSLSQMLGRT